MNQRKTSRFSIPRKKQKKLAKSLFIASQLICILLISAAPNQQGSLYEVTETPSGHVATADELVYFTNLRRTQFGLPALSVNSILMSTAQQTADRMAGIHQSDHLGGVASRIQQAGYGGGVRVWATENVANGSDSTAEQLVYVTWNDDIHNIPVMNPIYCDIGAGVAQDSEGKYYFVLHAAYTDKHYCGEYIAPDGTTLETIYADQFNTGDNSKTQEATEVSQYMQPVGRVTPNTDGQILHEVSYGQTLWSIAITYGTKIKEIQALNGMTEDNQTVYPGQVLLIPTSLTPYPTEEMTVTPQPEKSTQISPTRTQQTTQTLSSLDQVTTTPGGENNQDNSASFSTIIFWVAVGGLLLVLFGLLSRYLPSADS
jgi:uncharacterized protein YkwD/LysM repeat protein